MLKKIPHLLLLFAAVLSGCENESQAPEVKSTKLYPNKDVVKAIHDFSMTVASASNEKEFRDLLKNEALLKFDYDYDILYEFIKDKHVKHGSVDDLLRTHYNNLVKQNKISNPFEFEELTNMPLNLQLSIPKFCEEWNATEYIPDVIANTYVLNEEAVLKSYSNSLTESDFEIHTKLNSPVIVVGQSERIDKEGRVTVSPQHLVLPEDGRISKLDAYNQAKAIKANGRKSADIPPILVIVKDEAEANARLASEGAQESAAKPVEGSRMKSNPGNNDVTIQAVLVTPVIDARYSITPGTITLNWIGDVNATGYEVFMDQGSGYSSTPYATTTIESYTVSGLTTGKLYRFRVRGFDATGYSLLSNETEIRPAPRADDSGEYIRRVYVTEARLNQIEPGVLGSAELEVRVVKSYLTAPNVPSTNTVQNTFQRNLNYLMQRDKWVYFDIPLGNWRTEDNTYIINLIWQEDDGLVSTLKSYDVQVSSEAGFSLGIEDEKLKFGITGKTSKVTTYHYEVAQQYYIIGSTPIFFYEQLNTIYDLDGFRWRMMNSGEAKCPYIGTYDGTACLVGTAPTYPFSTIVSGVSIANGSFLYSYATAGTANSGNCSLPGSTLISVSGSIFKTTKCKFRDVPAGTDAYTSGTSWYVNAN